jgi:UDP-3-O-[3-hydroxymyristoyl] glucosamine N-acyltransferase
MKLSAIVETLTAMNDRPLTAEIPQDLEIVGVAAVDKAEPGYLSYIEGLRVAAELKTTQASALILPREPKLQQQATERGIAWIEARDPRLMFAQAIDLFYKPFQLAPSIHPSAVIDPTAVIGQEVAIGANVVIQAQARIGDRVCIFPNVVIYPEVEIGDRTLLHANCVIQERTRIGADCVIHSGAVIGAEGFGFVPIATGWYKMQQSGYVVLEDRVEVGCNSTIDRPAVGETRLKSETKLDNLVHIGHGCQIGFGCAIAAQTGLAGRVELADRVILAGQVGISNNVKIGKGVVASSKTGIHSDVEAGKVVSGYPEMDHRVFLRASNLYRRLPELYYALKRLQKRLDHPQ